MLYQFSTAPNAPVFTPIMVGVFLSWDFRPWLCAQFPLPWKFPWIWTKRGQKSHYILLLLLLTLHPLLSQVVITPGSSLTPKRIKSKRITINLSQKSSLMPLSLPLLPHQILKFHQKILQVNIKLMIPVNIPFKLPKYLYIHSHLRNYQRRCHQKKNLVKDLGPRECPSGDLSIFFELLPPGISSEAPT